MKKTFLFIILILMTLSWHLSMLNNQSIISHVQDEYSTENSSPQNLSLEAPLTALSHYPKQGPSTNMPLLEWKEDLNAVYYELELFDTIPDDLNDEELSSKHLYYTASVYTNAKQLDLTQIAPNALNGKTPLYWRIRSMDIDHNPITKFSALEELYATNQAPQMNAPIPHVIYNEKTALHFSILFIHLFLMQMLLNLK